MQRVTSPYAALPVVVASQVGTSITSITIEALPKTFQTQSGRVFRAGDTVLITSDADPTVDWMRGVVTVYAGASLTVDVQTVGGDGTHADWTIRREGAIGGVGPQGLPGGVYADEAAGLADTSDGDLFQVQGAGDTFTSLFKNVSGNAVDQDLALPSKSYTDAILNNLEGTQSIGRPNDATLIDGTTVNSNTYFAQETVARGGYLRRVRYFGKGSGTAHLRVADVSGTTLTIVKNIPFTASPGEDEAEFNVWVDPGQVVGFYGVGLFSQEANYPDGLGYWRLSGDNTTSGAGTIINTGDNIRLQIGFDIAFQEVSKVDVTETTSTIRSGVEKVQIVGRPIGTPLIERAGISNTTVVLGQVAEHDGWIDQIDYYGLVAGKTWWWGIFDVDGDTKTTGLWRPIISQVGEQKKRFDPVRIDAGQAVGYYAYDNATAAGIIANGSSEQADDGFGAWATGNRFFSFTDSSLSRSFSSEIRFHIKYVEPVVSLRPLPIIKVFLVIGQSNAAGRGPRAGKAPDGAVMWKVATQELLPLADPTGNDDTAGGSAWPRFATVFQDRNGYRCGIVNLAVGSTNIVGDDWATSELRAPTQTEWEAAVAAFDAMGVAWEVGGIICNVGEWDANDIDAAITTAAAYKAAYVDLIAWARTLTRMSSKTPFIIIGTGTKNTGDTAGYAAVRNAQREVVRENANVYMGWSGAQYLAARLLSRDTYHYKFQGYDEMGQSCAIVASAACVGGA